MADVVLDANVLVGLLDDRDVLAPRAVGAIDDVVSFDQGLDAAPGFRRIT